MVGSKLLIILLLLGMLPVAHAYAVERVWVDWQGNTVRTLAPGSSLPGAVLKIKLTNDTRNCLPGGRINNCTLSLRAAALSTIPAEQRMLNDTRFDLRNCENSTIGLVCTTQPFTFSTGSAANTVHHVLRIGNTPSSWLTASVPITLDTTRPRVTALKVGYCEEERCYASTVYPTPFTITFEDTQTSFDYKQVYIGTPLQPSLAYPKNCTGKTCIGELKVSCRAAGDEQTVQLLSMNGVPSREDSQNPIDGEATRTVVCTSDSPQFIEPFNVTAGGTVPVAVVGGSVTYRIQVRAPHGTPKAVLKTERINGRPESVAVCQQGDIDLQVYDCTWQLSGLREGTHDLEFSVHDETGNKAEHKRSTLKVYNVTVPRNNRTDLFVAHKKEVIPERINRLALDLAASNYLPYPAYVTYTLEPKRAGNSVLRQELDQCWYKLTNETNYTNSRRYNLFSRDRGESRVLYPTRTHLQENRLNLQLRPNRDVLALADTFDVTCQLKLTVKDNSGLYSVPEFENITFKIGLRESPLGQPGQAFVEEIKREEERLSGADMEFLQTLETTRATLDGVCQVMDGINTLGTTGSSLNVLGYILKQTGYGAIPGQAMQGTAQPLYKGAEKAQKNLWVDENGRERFIAKVCKQVNCRNVAAGDGSSLGAWNAKDAAGVKADSVIDGRFGSSVAGGINAAGSRGGAAGNFVASELTTNLNAPNVKDSFVMSAMYGCVGGMIYNAEKLRDINCGRLQCLKEQSVNGGSITVCDAARDAKVCMQITGEVMELPWARVVTNLRRNMDHMLQNVPGMAVKFTTNKVCAQRLRQDGGGDSNDPTAIGCHVLNAVTHVVDFTKETQQVTMPQLNSDAICFQALCNAGDEECPTSYNKIEKFSRYAQYTQINAWLRNKQRQSGTQADQQALSAVADQYKGAYVELESYDSTWTIPNPAGATAAVVAENVAGMPTAQGTYTLYYTQDRGTYKNAKGQSVSGYKIYVQAKDGRLVPIDASQYRADSANQYGAFPFVVQGSETSKTARVVWDQTFLGFNAGTTASDEKLVRYDLTTREVQELQAKNILASDFDRRYQQGSNAVAPKPQTAQLPIPPKNAAVNNDPFGHLRPVGPVQKTMVTFGNPSGGVYTAAYVDTSGKSRVIFISEEKYKTATAGQSFAVNWNSVALTNEQLTSLLAQEGTVSTAPATSRETSTQPSNPGTSPVTPPKPSTGSGTQPASATQTPSDSLPVGRTVAENLAPLTVPQNPQYERIEENGQVIYKVYDQGEYLMTVRAGDYPQLKELDDKMISQGVPPDVLRSRANFELVMEAAKRGVKIDSPEALEAWKIQSITIQQQERNSEQALFIGQTQKEATERANLLAEYRECLANKCARQQDLEKALAGRGIQATYSNIIVKGSLAADNDKEFTCRNNICSRKCTALVCDTETYYQDADGKIYKAEVLEKDSALRTANAVQNRAYWQTFDFVANIAVKWAYDEGYLNFLSTSTFGEWGRDVSQWSNTYISPDGWKQNFCSNYVNMDDADDGVILDPVDEGFTKIAGTFAAEVREIENETGTSYAYIYTIYVTNPQRPAQPGEASQDYDYRMDAIFDTPACSDCEKRYDLIDGRFKLDEGTNFAKGNGPRRGIVYLPAKYTRFCITFDQPFPNIAGKTSYCREIKENIYNTGSPYVERQDDEESAPRSGSGSNAPNTPPSDPDGSGTLKGEI